MYLKKALGVLALIISGISSANAAMPWVAVGQIIYNNRSGESANNNRPIRRLINGNASSEVESSGNLPKSNYVNESHVTQH